MRQSFWRIEAIGLMALLLSGCGLPPAYQRQQAMRAEQATMEKVARIERGCPAGADGQWCRDAAFALERDRAREEAAQDAERRERIAAAFRNYADNQARIAAAQAAQPVYQPQVIRPTQTNCWRTGQSMQCQSY